MALRDYWRRRDEPERTRFPLDPQYGEVVLSGTVDSRFEKRHAEDLIERIPGVRDVINSLRVTRS